MKRKTNTQSAQMSKGMQIVEAVKIVLFFTVPIALFVVLFLNRNNTFNAF